MLSVATRISVSAKFIFSIVEAARRAGAEVLTPFSNVKLVLSNDLAYTAVSLANIGEAYIYLRVYNVPKVNTKRTYIK